LHLYDIDAALEFEWRRNNDEVTPDGGSRRRTTEDRFREIFELRTTGFIGNPDLVEIDLGGRLRLEQRWLDATSDETSDQVLYDWNVSGLFIKESRFPFTIYSRQTISDIDRVFAGSLENRFREDGARVNLRSSVIPTNLQVFRRQIEQRDTSLDESFTTDQDTFLADGRIEMGQAHRLAWDVKYDDVDESGDLRVPISFDRFEANATHTIEFGDREQHFLRTRYRYFDETGDRNLRQIRIDPRLRFRHSDDFTHWYDYSFARDDRPQQEQRTHRASANFQHQLFDSLSTFGSAGFEFFDIPSERFDSDEYFGRLDVEYLKEVPLGRLSAGVNGFVSRVDDSERGSPIAISGDLFTFNAANLVVIDVRNVEPASIFITDVTGTIVYSQGPDYTVLAFPDRVEIRR
ncbi:MAG: hypothetical protein R3344_14320, partial [Acidobacteriota bacterium]|nr:hypothetical protein [Acidobacteriota bacterium]